MTVEAKPVRTSWRPSPLMVRIVFGALLVVAIMGPIYIGLPMNYYLLLYTSAPAHGRAWVIFTVLTAAVSDVAALLVGGAFGRTPFFAAISPKKTVEGAIAGVVFCVPAVLLGAITG